MSKHLHTNVIKNSFDFKHALRTISLWSGMALITLITDFGTKDPFVGAVKGTILSHLPDVSIVDISHDISPFNIQECAYTLKNAYHFFPVGTIHVVGVDAEWSPENRHIVVQAEGHYFIGANNGIISLITSEVVPENVVEVNIPHLHSQSFPVLQVFVSVACHLARGGKLEVIGKPFKGLKALRDFEPRVMDNGNTIVGSVVYIDNYGNVVTNIQRTLFAAYRNGRDFEIVARTTTLRTIQDRYNGIINFTLEKHQRKGPGDALALFNAAGYMELAIYKSDLNTVGGASSLLGLQYRDRVTVRFLSS